MKLSKTHDGIYYLYDYYPTRFKEYHHGISEKIIDFKNGNVEAIDYFCRIMKETLDDRFRDNLNGLSEYMVCIMPSHDKGMYGVSLKLLASFLVDTYGMEDATELVQRIKTHDRNSNGGDRSIAGQLETLAISNDYDITERKILLLDDVTTSGNSIEAVKRLIANKGIKWLVSLTLGRTTYPISGWELSEDLPFDPSGLVDNETAADNNHELSKLEIIQLENTDITEWNFEELKEKLTEALSVYKNMVYAEGSIKSAKKDKADLNKAKKVVEDARKTYKRKCLEPYNAIEPQILELTNMIEIQRIAVDEVVKDFERKRIEQKEEAVRSYYDSVSSPLGEYADSLYERLRNPKWFNASTEKRKYEEGIRIAINEAANAINEIRDLNSPFYDTVLEKYLNTLSLDQAIAKHEELMMAASKAGIRNESFEIKATDSNNKENDTDLTRIRRIKLYVGDGQFDKILKYMKSMGIKCIIEE